MLWDFRCPACDNKFEAYVPSDVRTTPCRQCGTTSVRELSPPKVKLEGLSGDFPSAYHAWQKPREKKMALERKKKAAHGDDYYL